MSQDENKLEYETGDELTPEPANDPAAVVDDPIIDAEAVVPDETVEEIAEEEEDVPLNVQLEQAEARAEEYLDSLQRERAAFQNYKKRVERERTEQRQFVAAHMLLKLLPTLDDFQRAMEAVPDEERDEWFEGVTLIRRKLERLMEDEGVTRIEALGADFDPNFHEAVGVDEDVDATSGTITVVLQEGYMHGDRVLRPALVRVAG